MSFSRTLSIAMISSASLLLLASCENAEKKAERKYQSAVELAAANDIDRAVVELRGVFQLDPENIDARLLIAELFERRGDVTAAFRQYLLAAEQHPSNVQARLKTGELAMQLGQTDQLEAQLSSLKEFAPDNPRAKALFLVEDLRETRRRPDPATLEEIRVKAEDLLALDPELIVARMVSLDATFALNEPYEALEKLDEAIAKYPDDQRFYDFKLKILSQLGDTEGLGTVLKAASEHFPAVSEYKLSLVRWYLGNGDIDSADAFLQQNVALNGDALEPRQLYIQFLIQVKGPEAALAQLGTYIDEGRNEVDFRALRAGIQFDLNEQSAAIGELRSLLEGREPGDKTRDIQVALARMLTITGGEDEARGLIDTVLEQDSRHVDALKIHADWLIEDDRVGDAIVELRTALDQAPQDAQIYSLIAKAHEREGNRDLMRENLFLAAEKSGYRAEESLRYARLLLRDEQYPTARDITLQALRVDPNNLALLRTLSEIYLGLADYPQTEQVIKVLRSIEGPQAENLANALEATLLQRMQRTDESMQLLRGMLEDDSTALMAQAAIIRSHLSNGNIGAARSFLDGILAEDPDATGPKFLNASLLSVEGKFDEAEAAYRDLLEENPEQEVVWRAYVSTVARSGDSEAAIRVLDEALTALPDSLSLLWQKASFEERLGDVEGAISIYEILYEQNSNSMIVANNLASLISQHRESQEDLQRAFVIARRLKGTQIPAFQDTYGWIAFRMGNTAEAVNYLESAASQLTSDPYVQEHYARALEASGDLDAAITYFDAALEIVGDSAPEKRAELEEARAAVVATAEKSQSGN